MSNLYTITTKSMGPPNAWSFVADNKFLDCELVSCDMLRFKAHRVVLAVASAYLYEKLLEDKKEIFFADVDGDTVKLLLQLIYQKEINVSKDKKTQIEKAAALLAIAIETEKKNWPKRCAELGILPEDEVEEDQKEEEKEALVVPSSRDGVCLIHNGYRYNYAGSRNGEGDTKIWRCSKYHAYRCLARVWTQNGFVEKTMKSHNH